MTKYSAGSMALMKNFRFYLCVAMCVAFSLISRRALADEDASLKITKGQETATVDGIYKKILAVPTEKSEGEMKLYTNTIPGTKINYAMVPIKSGEFMMGSPDSEPGRNPDEGPQH